MIQSEKYFKLQKFISNLFAKLFTPLLDFSSVRSRLRSAEQYISGVLVYPFNENLTIKLYFNFSFVIIMRF